MQIKRDTLHSVTLPANKIELQGLLNLPHDMHGLILFVHGSGSSRFSTRNQFVASVLNEAHIGTLLFDLLTPEEEIIDDRTAELRFNIQFLADRLLAATHWCEQEFTKVNLGYFGASTGGGAALIAAAKENKVKAIVSRGGRPDLADSYLPLVKAPTLLIVGGNDEPVIQMNENALQQMQCYKELKIVSGATHLFEEPGKLNEVAVLSREWFTKFL